MPENNLLQSVRNKIASDVLGYHSYLGDDTILVRPGNIASIMKTMKEEFQFEMLVDLTVVDYLGQEPRFEVVYHLNSISKLYRLRIKVPLKEEESIDSISHIWPIANWLEREAWDMFGVKFENHPDLRRILMYEEFQGHPLRKDYPIHKRQPRVKLIREEYERGPQHQS